MSAVNTFRVIRRLLAVVSCVALLGVIGYLILAKAQARRQQEAIQLIRDVDQLDGAMTQASFEFGLALRQLLQGDGSVDAATVEQAHRTLLAAAHRSIATVNRLEPPPSAHGKAFVAAERHFLLGQRQLIRTEFGRIVALLNDNAQPPAELREAVAALVDKAYQASARQAKTVDREREKFADEFNLQYAPP